METITITRENLAKYMALHAANVIYQTTGVFLSGKHLESVMDVCYNNLGNGKIESVAEGYQEYLNSDK